MIKMISLIILNLTAPRTSWLKSCINSFSSPAFVGEVTFIFYDFLSFLIFYFFLISYSVLLATAVALLPLSWLEWAASKLVMPTFRADGEDFRRIESQVIMAFFADQIPQPNNFTTVINPMVTYVFKDLAPL